MVTSDMFLVYAEHQTKDPHDLSKGLEDMKRLQTPKSTDRLEIEKVSLIIFESSLVLFKDTSTLKKILVSLKNQDIVISQNVKSK